MGKKRISAGGYGVGTRCPMKNVASLGNDTFVTGRRTGRGTAGGSSSGRVEGFRADRHAEHRTLADPKVTESSTYVPPPPPTPDANEPIDDRRAEPRRAAPTRRRRACSENTEETERNKKDTGACSGMPG